MEVCTLSERVCVICRRDIETDQTRSFANVGEEGIASLIHFSTLRGDSALQQYLKSMPSSVRVHVDCRKGYTCKRRFEQEQRAAAAADAIPAKTLRSSVADTFIWKEHCMLCAERCEVNNRNPQRNDVISARTLTIHATLVQYCSKRDDAWGMEVLGRLNSCCDVVAVDAIYHRSCYRDFVCLRSRPAKDGQRTSNVGRPVDEAKIAVFERLCSWLELCDDEMYSLDELQRKLIEFAEEDENKVYSKTTLKANLEVKYGDNLFFLRKSREREM